LIFEERFCTAVTLGKVLAVIAQKIIGREDAPFPIGDLGLTQMTDALRLERVAVECVGQDYLISGYLVGT
jgi:diaminohydroxyphosphoribosylaminopyrimidine deaminase / 5-amino-6-(5-phosphoribosylamino)uracil reductase